MNDVSIKVLDALFDLCEGEGYRILEAEEITSRISFHKFAPDELTEILEVLVADGLIELKYADDREYCVSMRTKGRALIKQSRERLAKIVAEEPEIISYKRELQAAEEDRQERIALEEKKDRLQKESEEKVRLAQASFDAADPEEKEEKKAALEYAKEESRKQQDLIAEIEDRIEKAEQREKSRGTRSLINAAPEPAAPAETPAHSSPAVSSASEEEKPAEEGKVLQAIDPKKVFLFALLGSAVGAAVVNLIFMIVFFIKYVK